MNADKIPEQNLGGVLIEKTSSPEERLSFTVKAEWIDPNGHCNQRNIDDLLVFAQEEFAKNHPAFVTKEEAIKIGEAKSYLKKKEVEFFKEMKLGDRGEVATIASPGNTSIAFEQRIYNQRRELVAQATYVVVLVGKDGKPTPLSKPQRDAIVGKK
jgi:acyl-CoA thioesterase FadM